METRVVIDSKFDFGNVVATSALFNHCQTHKFPLLPYLVRHANCDWGDVCKSDWESNDKAVKEGLRILSEYKLPDGLKIWIITEWDRSATTLLFPEDY
ncbi:MAG: hypothetical protein SPF41_08615 [Candidatus Merdousia sp.]|nr:hypothetical protein [Candidatus Merdousia sp.]